uniref:Uncharacterized protein n=1 Tax=Chromera velia CCMP2878 TaxID=1169474 RepID=A0A0K6SAJ4_9ALVE|eukprot:Cvel_10546.t4-p1 / transcript=Cvel_10546.t4 / gene=Cvel_10546 / organism=Chromera_velia_CCMP2878 / gene_product=hypothetical protein / transcript_product=hypothetical protein / location=Cvel_scaffold638:57859-62676(+) / protein_length=947 / sequence_SO=supercontig / SO=protein_coding / is_pseudo=false
MKSRDFTETVEEQLARIRQGIHEQHQGKHQNAISIFNEVLNDIEFSKTLFRAPVASLPYFHRAKSHAALRNFETALSDLRACPKTDVSRSAHVIRFTGEVYKDMGRYEDARNFYSAALFAKAGDLTTQDCLEELDVLELGRFCQVPDWLKKDVLKRAPSDMKPVRISSTHLTVGTTHANASAGAQQGQKKSMIVDMEAFVLKEAVPAGTYVILEKGKGGQGARERVRGAGWHSASLEIFRGPSGVTASGDGGLLEDIEGLPSGGSGGGAVGRLVGGVHGKAVRIAFELAGRCLVDILPPPALNRLGLTSQRAASLLLKVYACAHPVSLVPSLASDLIARGVFSPSGSGLVWSPSVARLVSGGREGTANCCADFFPSLGILGIRTLVDCEAGAALVLCGAFGKNLPLGGMWGGSDDCDVGVDYEKEGGGQTEDKKTHSGEKGNEGEEDDVLWEGDEEAEAEGKGKAKEAKGDEEDEKREKEDANQPHQKTGGRERRIRCARCVAEGGWVSPMPSRRQFVSGEIEGNEREAVARLPLSWVCHFLSGTAVALHPSHPLVYEAHICYAALSIPFGSTTPGSVSDVRRSLVHLRRGALALGKRALCHWGTEDKGEASKMTAQQGGCPLSTAELGCLLLRIAELSLFAFRESHRRGSSRPGGVTASGGDQLSLTLAAAEGKESVENLIFSAVVQFQSAYGPFAPPTLAALHRLKTFSYREAIECRVMAKELEVPRRLARLAAGDQSASLRGELEKMGGVSQQSLASLDTVCQTPFVLEHSPLGVAFACGHPKPAESLLDRGADLNTTAFWGHCPLHFLCGSPLGLSPPDTPARQGEVIRTLVKVLNRTVGAKAPKTTLCSLAASLLAVPVPRAPWMISSWWTPLASINSNPSTPDSVTSSDVVPLDRGPTPLHLAAYRGKIGSCQRDPSADGSGQRGRDREQLYTAEHTAPVC